jgi:plasmid stabilization system protein ParE
VSRELRFHRGARQELREAARWYEGRAAGLGAELVGEIGACLARVAEGPAVFPEVRGAPGVRCALTRRFPYAVVFLVQGDVITILAVAHGRRRPLYWRARGAR